MKPTKTILFKINFIISLLSVGGGYVIVPIMKKYFVDEYKFLTEDELYDIYAIAQSAPGAIAVNTSALVGYKLGKKTGALVSLIATILPPFISILFVAHFYMFFIHNHIVAKLLAGMSVGVAALMVDFVICMLVRIVKDKSIFLLFIALVSFICAEFLDMNVALILIISALISAAKYLIKSKIKEGKNV